MSHDPAVAMAFAVLQSHGFKFLAVSSSGHVVSHTDHKGPIQTESHAIPADKHGKIVKLRRRRAQQRHPAGYLVKALGYPPIMRSMKSGDEHVFPLVAGVPVQKEAMALANGCQRFWGTGQFSIQTSPEGIRVSRK